MRWRWYFRNISLVVSLDGWFEYFYLLVQRQEKFSIVCHFDRRIRYWIASSGTVYELLRGECVNTIKNTRGGIYCIELETAFDHSPEDSTVCMEWKSNRGNFRCMYTDARKVLYRQCTIKTYEAYYFSIEVN